MKRFIQEENNSIVISTKNLNPIIQPNKLHSESYSVVMKMPRYSSNTSSLTENPHPSLRISLQVPVYFSSLSLCITGLILAFTQTCTVETKTARGKVCNFPRRRLHTVCGPLGMNKRVRGNPR